MLLHWYPTLEQQQQSISSIVCAGPFTYKPNPTQNNWELHYKYCFYFKWGGAQDNNKQITDPSKKQNIPHPIQSSSQYKSLIRGSKYPKVYCTPGTSEEGTLQKKLSKECLNTYQLNKLYQQIQKSLHPTKNQILSSNTTPRRRKHRRDMLSPNALQRKFLPRNPTRRNITPAAHPTAAAAAANNQAQPHAPPRPTQKQTARTPTPFGSPRINRRFRPGFEEETEKELARIFKRPPRHFIYDPPFYPWVPIVPKVCFRLNFNS